MELIQFLSLYIIAITISISSVYAHFYYSSIILNKRNGLTSIILLIMLGVIGVILSILVPAKIIHIGLCLLKSYEWKNSWEKYALFLMVVGSQIPTLIIAIKKSREIETGAMNLLINKWLKNTVYIRFKSDWISARLVEKNRVYEDKPILAIRKNGKKHRVISIGSNAEVEYAKDNTLILCNGFDHPRSCIKDFEIAATTFRHFIRIIFNRRSFIRPLIVLHPLERIEGALTQVEARALKELGESTGAREAYVWVGRELTDEELVNLDFPETEGILGYKTEIG